MPAMLKLVHDADRPALQVPPAYEDLYDLAEPAERRDGLPIAQSLGGDLVLLTCGTGGSESSWASAVTLGLHAVGDGYHQLQAGHPFTRIETDAVHRLKAPRSAGMMFMVAERVAELSVKTGKGMPICSVAIAMALRSPRNRTLATQTTEGSQLSALLLWLRDHATSPSRLFFPATAQILAAIGDRDLIRLWGATLCGGEEQRGYFRRRVTECAMDLGQLWTDGWSDTPH